MGGHRVVSYMNMRATWGNHQHLREVDGRDPSHQRHLPDRAESRHVAARRAAAAFGDSRRPTAARCQDAVALKSGENGRLIGERRKARTFMLGNGLRRSDRALISVAHSVGEGLKDQNASKTFVKSIIFHKDSVTHSEYLVPL